MQLALSTDGWKIEKLDKKTVIKSLTIWERKEGGGGRGRGGVGWRGKEKE